VLESFPGEFMKQVPTVRVSATFVAEPVEPSLRFWLSAIGLDARVEFAPYNQVFQELLAPSSAAQVVFVRPEDWLSEQQDHAGSRSAPAGAAAPLDRYRLPNGIEVAELNRAETDHLYREIFRNRAYLRHGIVLEDEAVVVDCGANIGMFSLFAHLHARRVRLVAVEPSPRVASVLRSNAALQGMNLEVVEVGLSDHDGEAEFTFYQNYSLVSGFDAGQQEDESFLRAAIRSTLQAEGAARANVSAVETLTDYLVQERLRQTQLTLPVRRLSRILRERHVDRIDLLKIDVEKAELKVLAGIDDEHWPKIQQIVMEIHDRGDAIQAAVVDLERRGFRVVIEEERDLKSTGVWNLFAVRPEYAASSADRQTRRDEAILRNVADLAAAARDRSARSALPVVLVVCPPSAYERARIGHESVHGRILQKLREGTANLANVVVADAHDSPELFTCEAYYDWTADALGHMPYSSAAYDVIGTVAARALHTWAKAPLKVVVVDCDNTLWAGVAGEDGPLGVTIGPEHSRLHERLSSLQAAGVLLALNSKNEPADVWAVFDARPDLGIRRDQFIAAKLNWSPKSANIEALARELNLGADSFLFLDDNPVECAEVRARIPGITVLRWPTDPIRAMRFVDQLWALDIGPTTAEDRKRTEMYRQEVARRQLQTASSSFDAFLASLELDVTIAPATDSVMPRVAQLTERTNQFNFTTIRRTEDDIRRLAADGSDVLTLHVKDRFGDYGLVGIAIAKADRARSVLVIDSFLMSCRVLGKGVEHRLLAGLGDLATRAGLAFLEIEYRPTARNRPAWLFAQSAFGTASDAATPERRVFRMAAATASAVTFRPSAADVTSDTGDGEEPATADGRVSIDYQRIAELDTADAIAEAVHPVARTGLTAESDQTEAPVGELQCLLARIWSDLLHRERIGVRDNFFAIGGDSIIGIQVLSRARQAGLALEMRDLFEHDTIEALARVAESRRSTIEVETETAAGSVVPLTPIQRWFFEKQLPAPGHWNMEMVLRATGPVDIPVIRASVAALVEHHEALRYRFANLPTWEQSVGVATDASLVEVVTLPAAPEEARRSMAETAARLHGTLDLQNGPLLRAAVCVPEGPDTTQIIFVLHHLVCDGVTWRVLLEDFDMVYGQLASGMDVALPLRSTSYGRWAERLAGYGGSDGVRAEFEYWKAVSAAGPTPIRPDHPQLAASATERTLRVTPSVFSASETRSLLQDLPLAFDTQVNDVLLAALAVAFRTSFGTESLLVDLEGHGREPLFEGVDLSRTVGWFTTVFPVRLDAAGGDLAAAVTRARELRRAIPRRGIGYGVLRYLSPDSGVRETLASAPPPEVMFNYLGQFDQALGASKRFALSPDVDFGPLHGPDGLRSHYFEIIGRVVNGELRLDWMYSGSLWDTTTVARLIGSYEAAIRELLVLARKTPLVPSEAQPELQARFGDRRIESVHALAPIQRLFLVALESGQHVGLDQWRCRIEGDLDVRALERAWNSVVARHGALRTAFVSDAAGGPLQVVLGEAALTLHVRDVSELDPAAQEQSLVEYLTQDRQQGFSPLEPPLMRVAVFRRGTSEWEMVWTFHHLLIDGWSCPLIFAAVGAAYDADVDGHTQPTDASTYGDYIGWLGRQRANSNEPFWRSYLSGYNRPVTLPRTAAPSHDVVEREVTLSEAETTAVHEVARRWRVSLNTLVQLAWALVLSRQSGTTDVAFGVAFSGRPADLAGVEGIIGPFVNNLPVRLTLDAESTLEAEARRLQADHFGLLAHQTTPLPDIQEWSEVGGGTRLFESLLVLQSYATASGLRALGSHLRVRQIHAPVRTNYPLTIVAVPASKLSLRIIGNPGGFAASDVERFVADLASAVRLLVNSTGSVAVALAALSAPVASVAPPMPRIRSAHPVPPRAGLESTVAAIWRRAFGLDDIGVDETFADLGGQSLLMVRVHAELERALGRPISIVKLYQHPTIRGLVQHLEGATAKATPTDMRARAARQAEALSRMPGRRRP
jgi:FkbH-like protein/FkbM family methyltransferase/non-ribosomal peptide synthase protein (TIGR01720 family)